MKLLLVITLLLATAKALNPFSSLSEAKHAESIAVDEGYKAAKAVGKLTDSIRPSQASGRSLKRVVAKNGSPVSRRLDPKQVSSE